MLATTDTAALLALAPDCLAYFGPAAFGPVEGNTVAQDIATFLRAGSNVVTTSLTLTHPAAGPADLAALLGDAAKAGATSLFATGIEPGYASDLLPLSLLSACDDVEFVRIQEIADYGGYPVEYVMRHVFGFGQPTTATPLLFQGSMLVESWRGVVQLIADALRVTFDAVDMTYDTATLDHDIDTAFGVVEAGTVAAVRFQVRGLIDGRPLVILEHVNRLGAEVAPDWPHGDATDRLAYRVRIEGRPPTRCELTFGPLEDSVDPGLVATAMRAVNAIPTVVAASPGLLSALDLPIIVGRNVVIGPA